MVRADWEFYKNALKGHYDSLALQSVQIQQATSHAKASLPAGMYVCVFPLQPCLCVPLECFRRAESSSLRCIDGPAVQCPDVHRGCAAWDQRRAVS
jgi:hypothetical protein